MFYVFSPRLIGLIKDLDVVLWRHILLGSSLSQKLLSLRTNEKMNLLRKNNSNNYKAFYDKFARLCKNNKIIC